MAEEDKLALEQLKIYKNLLAKRVAERDDDWQTIAQYALPQDSNITTQKTESISSYTQQIFDTTVIHAMEILASGLFNWWTPQNQPWAEYEPPNEVMDKRRGADDAVQYLGWVSDKAMKEFQRSNFYMTKATGDVGLAVFATDLIIMDESDTGSELFNFIHSKIGTYVIEENYRGIVDTARRELEMTYRQIEQMFSGPGDNIPEKMRDIAKGDTAGQKKFRVLHCIFPREDSRRIPGAKNGPNMPFASVYVSMDFSETMRESGYEETPILCRRFKRWVSVYGYGPGYLTLPDARQANYMEQFMDAAAEMHLYPRVRIPDNIDGDVDLRAGGITITDSNNPNSKPEEWATVSDYKLGMEVLEQKRQAIRDGCFVDAFKLLNSAPLLDKEMTAYEISQRQAEQLQNMTAVDSRTVVEFINPLMQRAFGIMYRRGKIPGAPPSLFRELGGGRRGLVMPEVVVTSRFNDALRALKNRGAEETLKFLMPIAQSDKPEVWDILDLDSTIRDYARNTGMAPDNIRRETGPNSVSAIRSARAKIQQQQRALQMAEMAGKAGAGLGKSPQFMQDQAEEGLTGKKKTAA